MVEGARFQLMWLNEHAGATTVMIARITRLRAPDLLRIEGEPTVACVSSLNRWSVAQCWLCTLWCIFPRASLAGSGWVAHAPGLPCCRAERRGGRPGEHREPVGADSLALSHRGDAGDLGNRGWMTVLDQSAGVVTGSSARCPFRMGGTNGC